MENDRTDNGPTPNEARAALDSANRADDAVRRPALPLWYFAAMAVLVALILLAQTASADQRRTTMFGALVVALLLNMWIQRSAGILMASHNIRRMAPFLAIMLVVIFGTAITAGATEADWVWVVGAVISAGVVMVTGFLYRRPNAN